jgi:GMP synthase-like glutamine amidotransferase
MAAILSVQHWDTRFEYNSAAYHAARGDTVEEYHPHAGQAAPDPRRFDLVVVNGGEMSAFDEAGNPWLVDELRFLGRCLKEDVPILGICLGSQLLARALGARAFACPAPEFGFKRIVPTEAGAADPAFGRLARGRRDFLAIEWHDDAWDLPAGARLLASSAAWPNQAFRWGERVLAIQFHLEFTQPHMAWAVSRPDSKPSADPDAEDRAAFSAPGPRYEELRFNMESLLGGLLGPSADGAVADSRAAR